MRRGFLVLTLALLSCGSTTRGCASSRRVARVAAVVTEIAKRVGNVQHGLGPVTTESGAVRFPARRLKLVVAQPDDEERAGVAHIHVLAVVGDNPSPTLDACLFGVGETADQALANAAELYVGLVFAPLAAQLAPGGRLDARPFSGDEPYGVPGSRGFVGGVMSTGHSGGEALAEAGIFAGLTAVPRDGALHLVKAVLQADQGVWLRTLELDGKPTAIAGERWTEVAAPPAPARAIRFAVVGKADAFERSERRTEAIRALAAGPAWLQESGCPTDIMPSQLVQPAFSPHACKGGRLLDCVSECEGGWAGSCYSAALELQGAAGDEAIVQRLFLRSCRLGDQSACTNAASGRQKIDACAVRTFERTCEQPGGGDGDPWGCAMLGFSLARGDVVPRDLERARKVLPRACALGDDDEACKAARSLLAEINARK